jgi:branched-chain amino acid transport system substrate-binding protein
MTRLRATLVVSLTGPLALFGQASATGLRLWATSAASLPAPWTGIDLTILDSEPNTTNAIRAALQDQPDVLFGPYGSAPMLAAARASQRVIWNHGGATSRLARLAFPHVINVLAPSFTYFASALQAIHAFAPTASTISLLYSTSGFGRDVAAGALTTASTLHLSIQAIPFEPSHALAAVPTVPDADILLVAGTFADELAVAPSLLTRPWRYAAFVGAGVEEVLAPLGHQREGLLGPAQWIASAAPLPDEGPDAHWFTTHYRALVNAEPPYPAVQAFASGLLYARCLRDSGSCEDEAILTAAQQLTCTTLYGTFQLDPLTGLQSGHQILIIQWQQGQRHVIWPPEQAERSLLIPLAK